jgi:hypothetical protein
MPLDALIKVYIVVVVLLQETEDSHSSVLLGGIRYNEKDYREVARAVFFILPG